MNDKRHVSIDGMDSPFDLVGIKNDLQQFLGGGRWKFAHSEIVDNEQRYGRETFHERLPCAVDRGFGEVIQERMGFPIDDAIALLEGRQTDGLSQMTLAGAGWAEKQGVFMSRDEGRRG